MTKLSTISNALDRLIFITIITFGAVVWASYPFYMWKTYHSTFGLLGTFIIAVLYIVVMIKRFGPEDKS